VFASLITDPDDPECPDSFRALVAELLSSMKMQTRSMDGDHNETAGCVQPPGANIWSLTCSARCLSIEGIIQLLG
jgi:hypothetical protein